MKKLRPLRVRPFSFWLQLQAQYLIVRLAGPRLIRWYYDVRYEFRYWLKRRRDFKESVRRGCGYIQPFIWAKRSEEISVERLADAIYHAEGGAKTRHPYGILAKYKHTTPRQACINTINSNYKRWVKAGKRGDFITFLQRVYAPIGATNDPKNLNKNWERNVRYFLAKGVR